MHSNNPLEQSAIELHSLPGKEQPAGVIERFTVLLVSNKRLDQRPQKEVAGGLAHRLISKSVKVEELSGKLAELRTLIIENEKKTLEQVAAYHGATVHAVGGQETSPGNGVTFAEYELKVDLKDGSTFNPKQVQVMHWEDGLAKHVRFYYDPAQL